MADKEVHAKMPNLTTNARIAELEEAEERAYRAGYDMGHKNGANGVCFLPDGFWLAYKAGGGA